MIACGIKRSGDCYIFVVTRRSAIRAAAISRVSSRHALRGNWCWGMCMYICMCVCVCVNMYVYVYVYLYVHLYVCICMFRLMILYIYVRTYVFMQQRLARSFLTDPYLARARSYGSPPNNFPGFYPNLQMQGRSS